MTNGKIWLNTEFLDGSFIIQKKAMVFLKTEYLIAAEGTLLNLIEMYIKYVF